MSLGNPTLTLILTHTSCCDVQPGPSKLGTRKTSFPKLPLQKLVRSYLFQGVSSSSPKHLVDVGTL